MKNINMKGNSLMIWNMDGALKTILMGRLMKGNLLMGNNKGKELIGILMVHIIKDNGVTPLNMEKEYIEKEILSMTANGGRENQKDKENLSMDQHMLGNS